MFVAEKIKYPHHIFIRSCNENRFKYISLPQLHENDKQRYYYSICVTGQDGIFMHVPTHMLLVMDKDEEYGQYLITLSSQYQYLFQVLYICKDFENKQQQKKQRKRNKHKKIKHIKQGQQSGYKTVFKQQLYDQADKILSRLKYIHYNGKRRGSHYVQFALIPQVWNGFGREYMSSCCNKIKKKNDNIYFEKCTSFIEEIFGCQLVSDEKEGQFEAINVKFISFGSDSFKILFDMKYTDKNNVPHYEKMPE